MSLLLPVVVLVAFVGLGTTYGFLRALLAILMFGAIVLVGSRQMRSMIAAPPDPEVADVSAYDLRYVCAMCGLELKVEVAARDRAPSHCMEPMKLRTSVAQPPSAGG